MRERCFVTVAAVHACPAEGVSQTPPVAGESGVNWTLSIIAKVFQDEPRFLEECEVVECMVARRKRTRWNDERWK